MSKKMKYTDVRRIIYNRYHGKCAICGQPVPFKQMTIDHIIPTSKGGDDSFSNMQCACDSCNCMKHYLTNEELMIKVWKVALHNLKNILKIYLKGGASL